ncbi:MAG: hypothetical protein WA633_16520, partial [Stellaceae bacterium]
GELYPGQHPALIDDETWAAVRDQLVANASNHQRKGKAAEPSLLGNRFSIAAVWCQAPSSLIFRFLTMNACRLARLSLLSEVGAMAAT